MFRRLMMLIGLGAMAYAVPIIRVAHRRSVTCTNLTLHHAPSGTLTLANCANVTMPFLLGLGYLIVGAVIVLVGLVLGKSLKGQDRKNERAFRRDLKAGKYDFDPNKLDPSKNLGRFKLAAEEVRQREAKVSAPIPWEDKFLKPFPESGETQESAPEGESANDQDLESGEDAAAEIAQSETQETGEKDQ